METDMVWGEDMKSVAGVSERWASWTNELLRYQRWNVVVRVDHITICTWKYFLEKFTFIVGGCITLRGCCVGHRCHGLSPPVKLCFCQHSKCTNLHTHTPNFFLISPFLEVDFNFTDTSRNFFLFLSHVVSSHSQSSEKLEQKSTRKNLFRLRAELRLTRVTESRVRPLTGSYSTTTVHWGCFQREKLYPSWWFCTI